MMKAIKIMNDSKPNNINFTTWIKKQGVFFFKIILTKILICDLYFNLNSKYRPFYIIL